MMHGQKNDWFARCKGFRKKVYSPEPFRVWGMAGLFMLLRHAFPSAFPHWNSSVFKFVDRYGGIFIY
jgi:hypothetical protein